MFSFGNRMKNDDEAVLAAMEMALKSAYQSGEETDKDEPHSVTHAIDELVELIKQKEVYKNYIRCKKIVAGDENLTGKVNRIKEITYHIQEIAGMDGMEMEEDELTFEYERLYSDKNVHDFVEAELEFCRMFQKIMGNVMTRLDLD